MLQPQAPPALGGRGKGGKGRSCSLRRLWCRLHWGRVRGVKRRADQSRGRRDCRPESSKTRPQTEPARSRPDTLNDHSGERWRRDGGWLANEREQARTPAGSALPEACALGGGSCKVRPTFGGRGKTQLLGGEGGKPP